MKYEEAISKLDEIILRLEKNDVTLDEAIELYKNGIDLSLSCRKQLDEAKLKINEIDEFDE